MGEWKRVRLDAVCEIFAGGDAPADTVDEQTAVCKYPVYSNGITDEGLYGYTAHARVNCEAITISARGTIGVVFRRRHPFFPIVRLITAYPKSEELDCGFLYYQVKLLPIYGDGSAVKQLTVPMIAEYEIDIPPLPIQRRIAAVLGALDDKIEVNRKICENLEAQAQALFKAWFEDFEPFQGVVPEGWKSCVLGDVSQNIRQRVGTESRKVLSAVTTGRLVLSEEYFTKQVFSQDISKYIVVDEGDFAYNPARINIGSIGVNDLGLKGCVSPVYVTVRVDREYLNYFKLFFKTENFNREVNARAIGSVRQTLGYPDFAKIPCVYPDVAFVRRFNEIYESIDLKQRTLMRESRTLAAMRDALLPKLMSGELAVEKVEVVK